MTEDARPTSSSVFRAVVPIQQTEDAQLSLDQSFKLSQAQYQKADLVAFLPDAVRRPLHVADGFFLG